MKIPMSEYLSMKAVGASTLRTLLERCPAAAWHESAFNDAPKAADDTDASDAGTIIHEILLEGSTDCCVVVDPEEYVGAKGGVPLGWTNSAIRARRDEIRLGKKIPVLKKNWAPIVEAVQSAQRYIESLKTHQPDVWRAFQPDGGVSEDTIVVNIDGSTACKIRPDRRSLDSAVIVDLKSTTGSAEPESWSRTRMIGDGYYLSAAFYQRVMQAYVDSEPAYYFLVVEQNAPYLCSLVGVDPETLALGHSKIAHALREWAKCAKANHWPGYPARACYSELPPWESSRWLEREVMDLSLGSQP